jgi:hypothetical protein
MVALHSYDAWRGLKPALGRPGVVDAAECEPAATQRSRVTTNATEP